MVSSIPQLENGETNVRAPEKCVSLSALLMDANTVSEIAAS
jgi:hypothetical protein